MHIAVAAVEVATKAINHDACNDGNQINQESDNHMLAENADHDAVIPKMNLVISDILDKPWITMKQTC